MNDDTMGCSDPCHKQADEWVEICHKLHLNWRERIYKIIRNEDRSLITECLWEIIWCWLLHATSSSSIGTATFVGFGLLNYRWVFSARRFLESAVASGTSNPQLGGPVIRMFQLPPPGVPHVWNDASEPQQRKVETCARNSREFCRKWRLSRHFWVLDVNLRQETDGFTSPPKEGALRIFSPEKSDGFGRVRTRELGYQRPARSPIDHRSRLLHATTVANQLQN